MNGFTMTTRTQVVGASTITVANIRRITVSGITYINGDGALHFIDFSLCADNWRVQNVVASASTVNDAHDASDWLQRCVGEHNLCAMPPYIEFFTQPRTRFEFKFESPCETRDERYYWLSEWVRKAGWTTFDRS